MSRHSNAILCMLAKESKHSVAAIADFYGISFYKIMHENKELMLVAFFNKILSV